MDREWEDCPTCRTSGSLILLEVAPDGYAYETVRSCGRCKGRGLVEVSA